MQQQLSVVGIDLAKRVFHVAGMDDRGKIVLRKRLTREALLPFIARLPPVVIGMEACGGAHYWGRRFREHGHTVKLIAPQFVKPYVKSNKNDPADAEAICEAVTRPTMRFVPIKEIEQQDLQALHRARARVVKARTALVNEIRGLLAEYGIVLPQSVTKFRNGFLATLEAERAQLTALGQGTLRATLRGIWRPGEAAGVLYREAGGHQCRASGVPALRDDPRGWAIDRHSHGGRSQRCHPLSEWAAVCRVDRPSAATTFHGRQAASVGD